VARGGRCRLSLAGPGAVKAVAARDGEKLKASHRAVQTFLMLALLQSVTAQDLRASPALPELLGAVGRRDPPAAAAAHPVPPPRRRARTRRGPRTRPRAEGRGRERPRAEAHAGLPGPDHPGAAPRCDRPHREARRRSWPSSGCAPGAPRARSRRSPRTPTLAADHVLAKTARRFLDAHRKAKADPHAAATGLEPRLASMVAFEEAAEPDALWKGLQQAVPAALEAKSADQFWSLARGTFARLLARGGGQPPRGPCGGAGQVVGPYPRLLDDGHPLGAAAADLAHGPRRRARFHPGRGHRQAGQGGQASAGPRGGAARRGPRGSASSRAARWRSTRSRARRAPSPSSCSSCRAR
jgi:hypothetical protein